MQRAYSSCLAHKDLVGCSSEHVTASVSTVQLSNLVATGVASTIREEYTPLDTVRICRDNGQVLKEFSFDQCTGGAPELIGVSRERLQEVLYHAADPLHVVLDATVAAVDIGGTSGRPAVQLQDGRAVTGRLLVGADGVRSTVAREIGVPDANFVGQAGYRGIAHFPGSAPVAPRTVCQVRITELVETCSAAARPLVVCSGYGVHSRLPS